MRRADHNLVQPRPPPRAPSTHKPRTAQPEASSWHPPVAGRERPPRHLRSQADRDLDPARLRRASLLDFSNKSNRGLGRSATVEAATAPPFGPCGIWQPTGTPTSGCLPWSLSVASLVKRSPAGGATPKGPSMAEAPRQRSATFWRKPPNPRAASSLALSWPPSAGKPVSQLKMWIPSNSTATKHKRRR